MLLIRNQAFAAVVIQRILTAALHSIPLPLAKITYIHTDTQPTHKC